VTTAERAIIDYFGGPLEALRSPGVEAEPHAFAISDGAGCEKCHGGILHPIHATANIYRVAFVSSLDRPGDDHR
jgi:hypothetical protein